MKNLILSVLVIRPCDIFIWGFKLKKPSSLKVLVVDTMILCAHKLLQTVQMMISKHLGLPGLQTAVLHTCKDLYATYAPLNNAIPGK